MPVTLTTGLFQVAQLPAAQIVTARVYLTNLESEPASAHVRASRLAFGSKREILSQAVEVPGNGQHIVELGSDLVEGQIIEVDVTLETNGFVEGQSGAQPAVAVVSLFTGDQSTSLLQWISAGDFVPEPNGVV